MNWLVWALVLENVATLQEIETHYDLCDVLDAHAALEYKAEVLRRSVPK